MHSPLVIPIPGSKSLTNRAMLLASLADGTSVIHQPLIAEDASIMEKACTSLGVSIEKKTVQDCLQYHITGLSEKGSVPARINLYVGNAGTVARFFCAVLSALPGNHALEGNAPMHTRPIRDLVRALRQLGAQISYKGQPGCLPLHIQGKILSKNHIKIKGHTSSQYLSALLMVAPLLQKTLHIQLTTPLVSSSYVDMTIKMMQQFGVHVKIREKFALKTFIIKKNQHYKVASIHIEPDASSASYFFALAAITSQTIQVKGFDQGSTQGDLGLLDALEAMGCKIEKETVANGTTNICIQGPKDLQAITWDMNDMSDVAPTLAVVACFAKGTTHIKNAAHMRVKESNRIESIKNELQKTGIQINAHQDGWTIEGQTFKDHGKIDFETYSDHRIAMALSLISLKRKGISILDPSCVDKTFPGFFDLLKSTHPS